MSAPSSLFSSILPNLGRTALPLREVDRAYLSSCKHSFTVAILHSSVHSFYSSSAVLLTSLCTSPFSSSFQFPLLKWDVVYWGECVHSLSPAPVWVLVGRNGPVMKQSTAVQTHTNQIYRCFGVCVGVYVCALVHAHVHPDKWLIKVTLCLISLFLPLSFSLFLSFSFASSYYFSLTIYLCSCLCVSWL